MMCNKNIASNLSSGKARGYCTSSDKPDPYKCMVSGFFISTEKVLCYAFGIPVAGSDPISIRRELNKYSVRKLNESEIDWIINYMLPTYKDKGRVIESKRVNVTSAYAKHHVKLPALAKTHVHSIYMARGSAGWINRSDLIKSIVDLWGTSRLSAVRRVNKLIESGYATTHKKKIHVVSLAKIVDPGGKGMVSIAKISPLDCFKKTLDFKSLLNTIVETTIIRKKFFNKNHPDKVPSSSRSEWPKRDYAIAKGWYSGDLALSITSMETERSISDVHRMRKLAQKNGYAKYTQQFNPIFSSLKIDSKHKLAKFIYDRNNDFYGVDEAVKNSEVPHLVKSLLNPHNLGIVWNKKERLFNLRYCDLLESNVKIYSVKKKWKGHYLLGKKEKVDSSMVKLICKDNIDLFNMDEYTSYLPPKRAYVDL